MTIIIPIEVLKEADGEDIQYILKQVGMDDQMLRQLIMTYPISHIGELLAEKLELAGQ